MGKQKKKIPCKKKHNKRRSRIKYAPQVRMTQLKKLPIYAEIVAYFFGQNYVLTSNEFVVVSKNSIGNSYLADEVFQKYNSMNPAQIHAYNHSYTITPNIVKKLIAQGFFYELIGCSYYDNNNWSLRYGRNLNKGVIVVKNENLNILESIIRNVGV